MKQRRELARRTFLKSVPAAVAGGLAVPVAARRVTQESPGPVDSEALACAARVAGLEFTGAEHDMALENVNRYHAAYEALRGLDVPLDTEPAFGFRPYLPGRRPPAAPSVRDPLRVSRPVGVRVTGSLESLAFQPVTALSALIEARRVSSLELTRMYLGRLKRFGERLECVITLTEDLALEQAAEADREIRGGRYRGPLHGIPWGAKDLFATRGLPTTWGAAPFRDQVIDLDATVVERLREAGAVLVAKLSMGALAQGGVWFGGSTKTPWNLERSSSGSSAGSGAATAAGLVGFALGTETLGSIISPSAACGVTGLRPTYGRVSRHGAMALSWTMDKIGPMCRSVEDCALVFNAIHGPDGRDETVVSAPFDWQPDRDLSGLRIGYVRREFEETPEGLNEEQLGLWEAQRPVLMAALDDLRKAGANLEPIDLPDFPVQAVRIVLSAEAATAFDDLTRSRGIDQLTSQGPNDWPNTFRSARFMPAVEYIRAQRARTLLMHRMDELMSRVHVFVSPTRSASLAMTNLTGHPAMAMKCGLAEGLPVALMLTGRLYDEATLLGVALAYERATPWHTTHPSL